MTTPEIADVLILVTNVLKDGRKALADDGKLGTLECGGIILKNIPEILAAIKDAGKIAEEFRNLDAATVESLADLVFPKLEFAREEQREGTNRAIAIIISIAHMAQFLRDLENWSNPPRAAIVEDND